MTQQLHGLFFVDTNSRTAAELQGVLRYNFGFRESSGYSRKQRIVMLPATERYPRWSHLQFWEDSNGNCNSINLACLQWMQLRGEKELQWNHERISEPVAQFMIEQARARTSRKMLPGYIERISLWSGTVSNLNVDGYAPLPLQMTVHDLEQAPAGMNGVYVYMSLPNHGQHMFDLMKQCMQVINSRAFFVGGDLYNRLRATEPEYPFLWNDTEVRIITRGHVEQSIDLKLKVPHQSTAAEVLKRAKLLYPDSGLDTYGLVLRYVETERFEGGKCVDYKCYRCYESTVIQADQTLVLMNELY